MWQADRFNSTTQWPTISDHNRLGHQVRKLIIGVGSIVEGSLVPLDVLMFWQLSCYIEAVDRGLLIHDFRFTRQIEEERENERMSEGEEWGRGSNRTVRLMYLVISPIYCLISSVLPRSIRKSVHLTVKAVSTVYCLLNCLFTVVRSPLKHLAFWMALLLAVLLLFNGKVLLVSHSTIQHVRIPNLKDLSFSGQCNSGEDSKVEAFFTKNFLVQKAVFLVVIFEDLISL